MKSLALTWYILSITISVKEQRPQWKYHSWLKKKGKKKSTINIIASRKKLAYHKIIALSLYFIIAWSGWFIIMKNSFVFFIFFFFITNITLSFLLYSSSLYSRSVVEVFITALTYRVIAFYSGKRFKDDVAWWEWFFSKVMEIFSRTFIFLWVFLVSIDFYWKQIINIYLEIFFLCYIKFYEYI